MQGTILKLTDDDYKYSDRFEGDNFVTLGMVALGRYFKHKGITFDSPFRATGRAVLTADLLGIKATFTTVLKSIDDGGVIVPGVTAKAALKYGEGDQYIIVLKVFNKYNVEPVGYATRATLEHDDVSIDPNTGRAYIQHTLLNPIDNLIALFSFESGIL